MARGRKAKLTSKNKKQERLPKRTGTAEMEEAPRKLEEVVTPPLETDKLDFCLLREEQTKLLELFGTSDLQQIPYLLAVAALGKFELVKKALKEGCDIDQRGRHGGTALIWAIRGNALEMADLLIARGANVDIRDDTGDCAIFAAAENASYNEHAVLELLEGVTNPTALVNKLGNTLVHYAVRRQWRGLLETLISQGASVKVSNNKGVTPLMLACARSNLAMARLLLEEGAPLEAEDDRGCTALCYALAHATQKNIRPPCKVIDLLLDAMKKQRGKKAIVEYVDSRLQRLSRPPGFPLAQNNFTNVIITIISPAMAYLSRNIPDFDRSLAITKVIEALEEHLEDPVYVASLTQVFLEIILSGELEAEDEVEHSTTENAVANIFMDKSAADFCLKIIIKYVNYMTPPMYQGVRPQWGALLPLICAGVTCCKGRQWLTAHKRELRSLLKVFICGETETQERRRYLIQRRVAEFQTLLNFEKDPIFINFGQSNNSISCINDVRLEQDQEDNDQEIMTDGLVDPPPTLEQLGTVFQSLVDKYENVWEEDRIAGYPGFITRGGSPLGDTREEQLSTLRAVERRYLDKLHQQWTTVENVLRKLSTRRYTKESKKILWVMLTHQVRVFETCDTEICSSRWCSLINSLKDLELVELFPAGPKVGILEKHELFVISDGGNFGEVEIGFDNGSPIALKRITHKDTCQILETLMQKLQVSSNYLICTQMIIISPIEAFLCTPLCEYNLGEYLIVIKEGRAQFGMEVLNKQIALGLKVLHMHNPPIIHGNLKPSNVLIDDKGYVRLAEFGIHKGLYVHARAPKSSEIWFSRENLLLYQLTSQFQCSQSADIQVCAMLMHFLVSGGHHPFGLDADDIVEAMLIGKPHLRAEGCDLQDLLSWMLVPDPLTRPDIQQVLNHVYFWDPARRWRFLMICACNKTESSNNYVLPREEFHQELSIRAEKHGIKGNWFSIVQQDFPPVYLNNYDYFCPTGLLRFIDMCITNHQGDLGIRDYFLTTFPAMPLSIYRLIEETQWMQHPALTTFMREYV